MAFRKAFSYLKYSLSKWGRNYNVVERADKVMKKEKLSGAAPRHPGTQAKIDVVLKSRPEIKGEVQKMPDDHLFRLKDVRVESETSPMEEDTSSKHNLPQSRSHHDIPLFGYMEPKFIPEGKCSLKQAVEFIAGNNKDSKNVTAEVIAKKYKMKVTDVQKILDNFRTFEYHYIQPKKKDSISKQAMDILGVTKTKEPNMYQKFAHLAEGRKKIAETAKEKK